VALANSILDSTDEAAKEYQKDAKEILEKAK